MSDLEKLILELQSQNRSFGREDLSGTFEHFLAEFDKTLKQSSDDYLDKASKAELRYNEAKESHAPQKVLDEIKREVEEFTNKALALEKQRTEDNSDLVNKELKKKAKETLSGRKWHEISQHGKSVTAIGDALGKFKGMGKVGGMLTKFGGALTKAAGPLGIVAEVCEAVGKAMKMYAKYVEHQAKQLEFENQKEAAVHARQLALTQSFGEERQAIQQNVITKAQNEIGMTSQLAVEGNAIVQNAKAAGVETGLKSLTDIAGGAFAAAAQQIDIETSVKKFQNKAKTMLGENLDGAEGTLLGAQNELADTQLRLKQQNIEAKNRSTRTTADTSLAMLNQKQHQENRAYWEGAAAEGANMIPIVNMLGGEMIDGAQSIRDANFAVENAKLEGVNQEKNYQAQLNEARKNITTTMEGAAADFKKYGIETQLNMSMQIYDAEQDRIAREEKAWLNFTQTIFNAFQKSETAAYQMGRAFGYNEQQLQTYAKNLSQTQITISQWGKTMEDMMKLQASYQESTGRNRFFSEGDFNKSFANGLLVGDDIVSQLNSGMEIFNVSVSDSNEMFYDMYRQVTKMGLNGKKFGKDLVNNLRLAEKYNFKNGVKGLMEMSKWAQNVRFNAASLDGMLDKVQEGGLEGIIKQSAELQVLGGNFAMGSDPLAMAYESFMDPEGYAKRMNGMIAGQGVFDSENGNVSFGIASQMMMRQYAKSTGQDYKDVLNQARQQVKVNKIQDILGNRFNEDQLAAIANNANYKDGVWSINTSSGVTKNIDELTEEDIKGLSGENDPTKSMDENIAAMRSTQEKMKAAQECISSTLQNGQWNTFRQDAEQMIENVTTHFNENIPEYVDNIRKQMGEVVSAQEDMVHQIMGSDGENNTISAVRQAVQTLINNTKVAIGITNSELKNINQSLQAAFPAAHDSNADFDAVLKMAEDLGGFQKAFDALDNTDSKWYSDDMTQIMERLRSNPLALNEITDARKKAHLAKLIYGWDDKGATDNFNFHNNKELINYFKNDLAKGNANSVFYPSNSKFGGADNYEILGGAKTKTTQRYNSQGLPYVGGNVESANDGLILQNGDLIRIDKNDQVLAAKSGGPLDRMLDMVQPQTYGNNNGEIKVAPISITINGSINVNGSSIDLTNDPNFKEAMWALVSQEVSKRVGNTGRLTDPIYNRIQTV